MATPLAVKAQVIATKLLRDKYRDEYTQFYRQAVIDLGGKPHRTKEERIAELQEQIKQLEAK
jgi:hypothetical protein